jgi:hypothetical protein
MKIKVSMQNPVIRKIVKACYPNYRGRKIFVDDQIPTYDLRSYWDDGSRTYYVFYQPVTDTVYHLGSNHPWFESKKPVINCEKMPESVCLVAHSIFCGKDTGITIYTRKPSV